MGPSIKNFEDAYYNDATVQRALDLGISNERLIAALAEEKRRLIQRILALELIVPFKMETSDGKTYVWRCPDDLVPFIDDTNPTAKKAQ